MTEEKEYDEIEGVEFWQPEKEGDEIVGKIKEFFDGTYGKQAVIEQADGKELTTPSHKVLQTRLVKLNVGDEIKIQYRGEEPATKKGNNPTKMYKVFKAK